MIRLSTKMTVGKMIDKNSVFYIINKVSSWGKIFTLIRNVVKMIHGFPIGFLVKKFSIFQWSR